VTPQPAGRSGTSPGPRDRASRGGAGGPPLVFDGVSRWYGDTVALADVSFTVGPGVTGLLGHNGAGKSTALKLCAGFTVPSSGTVRVLGTDLSTSPDAYRRIGISHDRDAFWPFLTARAMVALCARLRGVADPDAAAERALRDVGLEDAADRRMRGFSHGMRQRVKLAQALAHDPELLLLDEPLNGLDPAQRRGVVELIRRLGEEGRTVIVSSHVLHEVERMAPRVLVLVNGHLVASGATTAIRELIADRPRVIRLEAATEGRALARELVGHGLVESVRFDDGAILVESGDVEGLSRSLPRVARDVGARLRRVEPVGDDLESVYAYLHERARGVGR